MVAKAVHQTVREAKKAKLPAERSEESIASQRERQVRGLPGYAHSSPLDMSKPLGKRSRTKRQGASNIGNWTSESRGGRAIGRPSSRYGSASDSSSPSTLGGQREKLISAMVSNGIDQALAAKIASQAVVDPSGDLGDPRQLGMESRVRAESAIRKLVGMIVDEEVRVARRR